MAYTITVPVPEAALDVLVDHSIVWWDGARALREDHETETGDIARYVSSVVLDFGHWAENDAFTSGEEDAANTYLQLTNFFAVVRAAVLRNDDYAEHLEGLLYGHMRLLDTLEDDAESGDVFGYPPVSTP